MTDARASVGDVLRAGVSDAPRVPAGGWLALGILSLVSFVAYMDRMGLAILLEPIKADLKLRDGQLGLLSGLAFALLYSVLGLPLARLADRSHRLRLLSACLALWSLMTALTGSARSFAHLFAARVGVGIGEAGCIPAAHSLIADYFPPRHRTLAITIFQTGAALGASAGLFALGYLGQALGWRTALRIVGLAGLPVCAVVLLTLREPRRARFRDDGGEPMLVAFGGLLRRRAFVHLVIGYALSSVCAYGTTQWLPTFLMRSFGMSMAVVGAWSGIVSAVGGTLGLLTGGVFASVLVPRDPRWELWLPALTYGLSAPAYLAMLLSGGAWMALSLQIVAYFLSGIGGGVALAAVQSFAEPHRRASAVAIALFLSSLLGIGAGPFLIGAISDALAPALGRESLRYALFVVCVVLAWAVAHYLLAARDSERDRVS